MPDVGLHEFNQMPLPRALKALGTCCGSSSWCFKIASGRPYPSRSELLRFSDLKFQSLTKNEWMEAFAHHTPIGTSLANDDSFSVEEKQELQQSCLRYKRRFGHVFIVETTGMQPREILSQLQRRLKYDAYDELHVAGQHQGKITRRHLLTLLDELLEVAEIAPIAEMQDSSYLIAKGRYAESRKDATKKSA